MHRESSAGGGLRFLRPRFQIVDHFGGESAQDLANLPHMETGLRSLAQGQVQLGHYQERRIRHFHRALDHYLEPP